MRVLWCVTGAGHLLRESSDAMRGLSKNNTITVAFSAAGEEVARMYGLLEEIKESSTEFIFEKDQGASSPLVGRLAKKEYHAVVVSPCTANTAAKIVHGIADSLVTNVVAQAVKSSTRVYLVPTDVRKEQDTVLPLAIDAKKCRECERCPPKKKCPNKAIYRGKKTRVDMLKCDACKKCVLECTWGAISFGRKASIRMRDVDLENTKRLGGMEGIKVLQAPAEIRLH